VREPVITPFPWGGRPGRPETAGRPGLAAGVFGRL